MDGWSGACSATKAWRGKGPLPGMAGRTQTSSFQWEYTSRSSKFITIAVCDKSTVKVLHWQQNFKKYRISLSEAVRFNTAILLSLHAMAECIIILGSNGQIGTELVAALRAKHGQQHVVAADIRTSQSAGGTNTPFEIIDVLDRKALHLLFTKYHPTQIYLLAAVLSANGEKNPRQAWDLNINGLLNVLDLSIEYGIKRVFWPSSIAVFGPHSPKNDTPEYCTMDPTTVYGISKLAGERICEYYYNRFGLDIRSIRYPGIISWKAAPGGGTT